ncbi:reducing polyketide synthase swnK-like [Folsomia candida]|uniref:reducing polyketide synthase swnK-like n=1 Tax=Folsomia candida TaxID=158441 RepID=UPI001605213D|nr:reducing polyketide synthase swnK-like [Folsomia candida]
MASQIRTEEKSVPFFILPFSAECATSLEVLRRNHIDALELIKGEEELASYCYTASTCCLHFSQFRSIVTGANRTELLNALRAEPFCCSKTDDVMKLNSEPESNGPTPLSFLFSGAGAEFFQMGLELYQTCPSYRSHFDDINSQLMDLDGIDLLRWLRDGEEIALYSLISIFALEYSLLQLWADWGVRPTLCVVGHSFGELAAAVAVGGLSLPTAARLVVSLRQSVLRNVKPGRMLMVLVDEETTRALLNSFSQRNAPQNTLDEDAIDICIINSTNNTIVP